MDTSEVEKFFAIWSEDEQQKGETLEVRAQNIYSLLFKERNFNFSGENLEKQIFKVSKSMLQITGWNEKGLENILWTAVVTIWNINPAENELICFM